MSGSQCRALTPLCNHVLSPPGALHLASLSPAHSAAAPGTTRVQSPAGRVLSLRLNNLTEDTRVGAGIRMSFLLKAE